MIKYDHIIWDWNGTILNDAWLCVEIVNLMLSAHGLKTITISQYKSEFDFPVYAYYKKLGFELKKETYSELAQQFIQLYEANKYRCQLQDGICNLIEFLNRRGVHQHILSVYMQDKLDETVTRYGIRGFFDTVTGRTDVLAYGKLELGVKLISRLESPEKVLIIGDTTHDAMIARNTGVNCVLVTFGHHSKERLINTGYITVDSVDELYKRLMDTHNESR